MIFYGNNSEYIHNKVEKTIIALSDYELVKINNLNYHDITKESLDKDICLFNCKYASFEGDLYYISYNKFLQIYEKEDNVKLYTSELLFQNIYYIIQRLLFHKKYVIKNATKKENENKLEINIKKDEILRNNITGKAKINLMNITKTLHKKKNQIIIILTILKIMNKIQLKQIFSYISKIQMIKKNNKISRIKAPK